MDSYFETCGALSDWAPSRALSYAEAQFLEMMRLNGLVPQGLESKLIDGTIFLVSPQAVPACGVGLCLEQGKNNFSAQHWVLAEGAFGLATRLQLAKDDSLTPAVATMASGLAETLRVRGNLLLARTIQEEILATLRGTLGADDPATLAAELQLGETLVTAGAFREASLLQAHVVAVRIKVLGEGHPDVANAMGDLGASELNLGNVARAKALFKQAEATNQRVLGPEHPATLIAENNLATAFLAQGEFAAAKDIQERLLSKCRNGATNPREALLYEGNLAVTLGHIGDHAAAREISERVLASRMRIFGSRHPDTLTAQGNLAQTLRTVGDLAGARTLIEGVRTLSNEQFGEHHPISFAAEGNLAELMKLQGDNEALCELALQALPRLPRASASAAKLLTRYAFYLTVLEEQSGAPSVLPVEGDTAPPWMPSLLNLLPSLSAMLRDILEQLESEERRQALEPYSAFHAAWLKLSERWAPDHLPQALAPMHGLESWSTILGRLLHRDALPRSRQLDEFLVIRQRLQQLRVRQATLASMIESSLRHLPDGEADSDSKWGAEPTTTHHLAQGAKAELNKQIASHEELQAEEAEELQRYRCTRDELARVQPAFAALLGLPALRAGDLARELGDHEALLITLVIPPGRGAVFVVRCDRSQLVGVSGLSALTECVRRYQANRRSLLRCTGLRDGIIDDSVDILPSAALETSLGPAIASEVIAQFWRDFWRPLERQLENIGRVHLITGPNHHSLPLECGAPVDLAVHRYFGLPAYLSIRDHASPQQAVDGTCIVADAAWDCCPIPFVGAEAEIVESLLLPQGQVQQVRGQHLLQCPESTQRLVLCLHGNVAGQQARKHGYLLLDTTCDPPPILDAAEVNALPARISEVYASACLAAVVGSDGTGGAIGICSEWQLKGMGSAIASFAPVEDHFMPLLAALYWHARVQGLVPFEALRSAKQALKAGAWPESLIQVLHRAYHRTMRDVLRRAVYREGSARQNRRVAQTVAGWLLPAPVRDMYFGAPMMSRDCHLAFSTHYCEDEFGRERLIRECLANLIEQRANPVDLAVRPFARSAIDNICAFTHCLGNGGIACHEERRDA